ncbi:alpha/beta hydrolase [Defluviimonas aestuarii]|uniref:alpha/beta fold hydrolase n=1 Tax=Albidovulum aestuarii TaxID=1130726 RepID=UPI00249BF0E7|nr:alpha/beta hydrolase [Defluviimonas aestuarii]MDI3336967.1 alpha/beta hydrolase [Defluviimonas aestuarii]
MLIQVDGIEVNFEERGSGWPILMLHGGYLDHRHMMDEMEPAFQDRAGWHRVYPDLPAHGRTPTLPRPMTFDALLNHVVGFIDAVAPGKRFAVAGMSAGGHLVRGLAAKYPDRLLGVFINATPFVIDYETRDLPEPSTIFEEDGFAKKAGDRTDTLRFIQPVRDTALVDWDTSCLLPALSQLDEAAALESWRPENYAFSFNPDEVGAPFSAPSLILGGRQDTIAGYRDAWMSVERFPRATFAVLDGCGHFIAPARRDLFRSLIIDWLDRMELDSGE